ncbi:MAG: hypothetical protein EBW11_12100 [Betaproteobacteria bacterium]|nr:hypothetical protein [Betaproteobacteria bacterium]
MGAALALAIGDEPATGYLEHCLVPSTVEKPRLSLLKQGYWTEQRHFAGLLVIAQQTMLHLKAQLRSRCLLLEPLCQGRMLLEKRVSYRRSWASSP